MDGLNRIVDKVISFNNSEELKRFLLLYSDKFDTIKENYTTFLDHAICVSVKEDDFNEIVKYCGLIPMMIFRSRAKYWEFVSDTSSIMRIRKGG
ncbi:MAG: hypothetical protein J6B01_04875 [Ruminococcus sp.]|nr:hypothetical protein [Ruminococcus sp.]MBO5319126.1 hypothetical protein [Ruminococcus sp.]